MMFPKLTKRARAFQENQSGSVALEAVIIVPIMVWAYLAMFTIFDSYRQYTSQQKAVYTISDLISRQATPMDADFMDGTHELFENLSRSVGVPGMRVTVAKYNFTQLEYEVVWSRTRGGMVALASEDVQGWTHHLPVLAPDDQIIIVETTSRFMPVFNIGLLPQTINNFIFTRPRYAKQVCFDEICDLPGSTPIAVSEDEQA